MDSGVKKFRAMLLALAVSMGVLLWNSSLCAAAGAKSSPREMSQPSVVKLAVGKSVILRSPRAVTRVSVASPDIADIVLLSPHQVYVTGKSSGITNLTMWGEDERVCAVYDVDVSHNVSQLKEKLNQILPGENGIQVTATGDGVTLSGTVSSAASLSQAMAVAETYAPKKTVNLLQVAGVQQIMLEVRVAEMQRSIANRLGVNLLYSRGGDFAVTTLNSLTQVVKSTDANLVTPTAPFSTFVTPAVNAFFRFHSGEASWTGFLDALKEDGLIKILAEPTLICLSGQTANFLAGGEIPIPVPQGLGTVAIEYKPFGVGLMFTPTVLNNDKINMKVSPEVSQLDYANAVTVSGWTLPAFTTRRTSTIVELGDGQSFAIAGLLLDDVREVIRKFPVLGSIPVLGALFRSSEFKKNETELIIVVTPHLVKPLDMAKQSLPTDYFVEPTDTEFFLLGVLESKEKAPAAPVSPGTGKPGLGGEFGHIMPQ